MKLQLCQRKQVWWPTWQGWLVLLVIGLLCPLAILETAEGWLAVTGRVRANVLVVEGWVDLDAIQSAISEYHNGEYQYVITIGGFPEYGWLCRSGLTYAQMAAEELQRLGLSTNQVLAAACGLVKRHRSYEYALSAKRCVETNHIVLSGVNVLTTGTHARRSRLIFHKVFGASVPVGVIAYLDPDEADMAWWESSSRTKGIITEGVAWLHELLLNGGR